MPPSGPREPDSPYLALVLAASLRLLEVNERLVEHWNGHARARGLTGTQAKLLLALTTDETVPMRALARRLSLDASNLTTLVDRLQERGLVRRHRDDADRRSRPVELTADGAAVRDAFWEGLTADAGPLAPLDATELERLLALLAPLARGGDGAAG